MGDWEGEIKIFNFEPFIKYENGFSILGGMMYKKVFILLISIIYLSGCAGIPIRTNPQFSNYFNNTRRATLMPIDIKVYKLTAGGVSEEMDEWEANIESLIKQEIRGALESSSKIKIAFLEESNLEPNLKEFLDEQKGLYRAVAQSIISHTYMEGNIFKSKLKAFDYTLGSDLNHIIEFIDTDSILFVSGKRTFWTGGRVMLATWGILLGAVTGVYVVPIGAPDWIAVALIDVKTGDILWFRYMGAPFTTVGDLREKNVASQTVEYLFKDFGK